MLLPLLFGFLLTAQPQVECRIDPETVAAAREWIQQGYGPGLVIATVDARGEACYQALGSAQAGAAEPLNSHSLFEIGSVTKLFTALSLAQLAEQGQLSLTASFRALLSQAPPVKHTEREISLQDLATHSSGLPRLPANFSPANPQDPYADYSFTQLWNFLRDDGVSAPVGSRYTYSNLGYGLLGLALSTSQGETYAEMIERLVIRPLGLRETAIALNAGQQQRLVRGHVGLQPVPYWNGGLLAGAYALHASAADLTRFVAAAMHVPGQPLAKAFTLSETPLFRVSDQLQVGLGWHLLGTGDAQICFHNGETAGFRSYVGFSASRRQGVVMLANAASLPVDDLALHLLQPQHPLPHPRREITLSPDQLDSLSGRYRFAGIGLDASIRRVEDHLVAGFVGQGDVRLYAESSRRFFLKEADVVLEFSLNAQGRVVGLSLLQNGQRFEGLPVTP